MPKKLAITIAGAVSLGSYEAGVLYEIVEALRQHNSELGPNDDSRIEIDVITGASAGGMTAAVAVQKLLFDAAALRGAYTNSLYRAWVQDVSLERLLNLQATENPTHSILSSNLIEAISEKHLTSRYGTHLPPARTKHDAAGSKIQLGLALSNLNGVDFSQKVRPGDTPFDYSCYQDQIIHYFDSANPKDDTVELWEVFRNAVVSCGAFPFAFRTKKLTRHEQEYRDPFKTGTDNPFFVSFGETHDFIYTDGGTFQNEPLGMAKNLVDVIDPSHKQSNNRFYLFVAPGARGSTANLAFQEKDANLGATGKQLVGAIFNQARFHDWIQAEDVNKKVLLFDTVAMELHGALMNGSLEAKDLTKAADVLVKALIPDGVKLAEAQDRAGTQWHAEFDMLAKAKGGEAAATWINSILTFETAAGLGDKDEMVIYGITAKEEELAGAGFESFLGFFDQAYRDHDYDVGRTKAREIIDKINADPNELLGPIHYPAREKIREIDQSLNGLKLKDVSLDLRRQFKTRLTARAHDFMAEIGIPTPLLRETIDIAFITPKLNQLLGL